MRRVGTLQLRLSGWRIGLEIPAHIARRESHRSRAADVEVREVLTHATTMLEYVAERRRHIGEPRVEDEVGEDPPRKVTQRIDDIALRTETRSRIVRQGRRRPHVA